MDPLQNLELNLCFPVQPTLSMLLAALFFSCDVGFAASPFTVAAREMLANLIYGIGVLGSSLA